MRRSSTALLLLHLALLSTLLQASELPPRPPRPDYLRGTCSVLPTGQVLFTDGVTDVEVYTAARTFQSSWRPTLASFPSSVAAGSTNNFISGTQFNGLSQGVAYGDDAQANTNYPPTPTTP